MALQFIIEVQDSPEVSVALGTVAESVELFPLANGLSGISVPTKVVDAIGEDQIRKHLSRFKMYDLYDGEWHNA